MPRCRPETVAFTATAPLRATVARELPAPPTRVFDVLADAEGWPRWFPGMRAAAWRSDGPHGVGSVRRVHLGPMWVDEEFIAWEPGARFGFTFVASNLPLTTAGVELVELVPTGEDRTRVSYTFAVQPAGLPRAMAGAGAPAVRAAVGRGLRGLERHLSR